MPLLERQLEVRKSTLPQAGLGLFTKKFIPKGTRIVEYRGKIVRWKDVSADDSNPYIFYAKRDHVIDARPYTGAIARFANDARGLTRTKGLTNNSIYEQEGLKIFITARRDIQAGAEIFVDYGREYWEVIRFNKGLEARVTD